MSFGVPTVLESIIGSIDLWMIQRPSNSWESKFPAPTSMIQTTTRGTIIQSVKNGPMDRQFVSWCMTLIFDAKLDDSLFSLTPPEGYALKVQHRSYVTEREMIDYLGVWRM